MTFKIIKKLSFILLITGTISAAYATGEGGYLGLMVGASNLHGQNQSATISPGVTETARSEGTGVGTRLFVGYNMNRYAAIEGGYTYFSSMTYKTNTFSNNVKTRFGSFDVLGKGMLPIADSGFDIFAKLGGAYVHSKTSGKIENVSIPGSSASAFRPAGAIGASYDITQNWVADLSYNQIFYSSSTVNNPSLIALGISYHLVDERCGQFLC